MRFSGQDGYRIGILALSDNNVEHIATELQVSNVEGKQTGKYG